MVAFYIRARLQIVRVVGMRLNPLRRRIVARRSDDDRRADRRVTRNTRSALVDGRGEIATVGRLVFCLSTESPEEGEREREGGGRGGTALTDVSRKNSESLAAPREAGTARLRAERTAKTRANFAAAREAFSSYIYRAVMDQERSDVSQPDTRQVRTRYRS